MRHTFDQFLETGTVLHRQAAASARFRTALGFALASLVSVGIFFCCLCSVVLFALFARAPRPSPSELPDRRIDYYELSASHGESVGQGCLTEGHSGESWDQDPREVGLCIAGYPNVDGTSPDIVRVFYPEPGKTVVVVITMRLMDDSVEAKKIRVDLVQEGEAWVVEWAGGQWRCYEGRGHWYWAAGLCS